MKILDAIEILKTANTSIDIDNQPLDVQAAYDEVVEWCEETDHGNRVEAVRSIIPEFNY